MRKLTDDETNALDLFAWENGRRWKQALRDEWVRACANLPEMLSGVPYRSTLQQLRNDPGFGTRGLASFRLPAGYTFKQR